MQAFLDVLNWKMCHAYTFSQIYLDHEQQIYEMLTFENLRSLYRSCYKCGVNWHERHVTLDCSECGGYSMSRPCPQCEGKCGSLWLRDIRATHENHAAVWTGVCIHRKKIPFINHDKKSVNS